MPVAVHESEVVLRFSKPLRGREAIQPPRLRQVLRSAMPVAVHEPEVALRVSMPLRGREPKQPPRLR